MSTTYAHRSRERWDSSDNRYGHAGLVAENNPGPLPYSAFSCETGKAVDGRSSLLRHLARAGAIPFPPYLVRNFEAHKRAQNEARLMLGSAWENNDLVFASRVGTPLSIRNLQRRHFKPILDRAKLEDIRTYDLRHSCASLLLAAGENPKVVSERLGHASIVLTLDTYSHVLRTMQQAATDKLEKILKG